MKSGVEYNNGNVASVSTIRGSYLPTIVALVYWDAGLVSPRVVPVDAEEQLRIGIDVSCGNHGVYFGPIGLFFHERWNFFRLEIRRTTTMSDNNIGFLEPH